MAFPAPKVFTTAAGLPVKESAAASLINYDSDSGMHDDQEPGDAHKYVTAVRDKENNQPHQVTRQDIQEINTQSQSRKRARSPTVQSPSARPKLAEDSYVKEIALQRIPNAAQKTQGVTSVLNNNAEWVEITDVARAASEAEKAGGILNQEEGSSTGPGNDSAGKRTLPPLGSQDSYQIHVANITTGPSANLSLDRMLPLVIAANDAYETDCSPINSESSKAPLPLTALDSACAEDGRHGSAQIVAPRLFPLDARPNNVEQDMVLDDAPDHITNQSVTFTHAADSGIINQMNKSETVPQTPTTERSDSTPENPRSKPEPQCIVSIPAPAPSNTKELHKWATHNSLTPYKVALMVSNGTVSKLNDPTKALPEDPYNDGYRYWTLPEYSILLAEKGKGKSWEDVAKPLPGRDVDECRNRWERRDTMRVPGPDGRHPHWHQEEEGILLDRRAANKRFEEIAEELPARSPAGCRTRWKEKFETPQKPESEAQQEPIERPWTKKENDELMDFREQGMSFKQIAKKYPARSKKMYKEHWNLLKELNYRNHRKKDASEDLGACASREQQAHPLKDLEARGLLIRDHTTHLQYPDSYSRTRGSNESPTRHAACNATGGSLSRVDSNIYSFPQGSRSSYSKHDHDEAPQLSIPQARPSCKNHFTSGGYIPTAARASNIPPSQLTLPPLSTVMAPRSVSSLHTGGRHSSNAEHFADADRRVMESASSQRTPLSAVEPGYAEHRAIFKQQPPPQQNEQYPFLYRRQGDSWQVTEVIDPAQQSLSQHQAPQTLRRGYVQVPTSETEDTASNQQASHHQPQYTPTPNREFSEPQPSAYLRRLAWLDHQTQPAKSKSSGVEHHIGITGGRNTSPSTPQSRKTTNSGNYPIDPPSARFGSIQDAFNTADIRLGKLIQQSQVPTFGASESVTGRGTASSPHQLHEAWGPVASDSSDIYATGSRLFHHGRSACG